MIAHTTPLLAGAKLFVTGGAGFIGTHLASHLADHNEIVLFDNLHNCAHSRSQLVGHRNVQLVTGDVRDVVALRRALDPDVDYVVHAAAIAGVDTVLADPLRVLEVNVKGTFNVAEAALSVRALAKFVDFSTSEVFGNHATNVSEAEIKPTLTVGEARWTYAMSKLVGEFIAHAHGVQNALPVVTLRPFNVYGPNQVGVGAIHNFVRRALDGDALVVHDDGTQVRAWCYVDDFVRGALLAMTSGASTGRTYNLGDPRGAITVAALARTIIDLADSSSPIVFRPVGYPDIASRIPDITAARDDLGYEPAVALEDGLQRTIAWYRRQSRAAAAAQ